MGWFKFGRKKDLVFKKRKGMKIGLALSGGAGRGIGHIGVIKAFESLGVEFDIVAGTSAGSLVGALYAYGLTSEDMENTLKTLKTKDIKSGKIKFMPSDTATLINTIDKVMGGQKVFSDLKKPFVAVATNLKTGKEVWIESGSVSKAVACSCAVPAAFKPVVWEEKLLCDGGLVNSLPINVCKELGADYVIAVDVNFTRGDGKEEIKGIGDIINSTIGIMLKSNAKVYLDYADYVLTPDLVKYKSTSFDNSAEMIAEGERVVLDAKEEIIKILNAKPKKRGKKCTKEDIEHI